MNSFKINMLIISAMVFMACTSSPPKVALESSNPEIAVENIKQLRDNLIRANYDVLAKKSFKKGERELKEAITAANEKKASKEILNRLAVSKAYFLETKKLAQTKKVVPTYAMEARRNATNAKLFKFYNLEEKLDDVDDAIIYQSNNFTIPLSTDKLSEFQRKYQELEIQSVQKDRLGVYQKIIRNAEENKARKLAPKTLTQAKNDVYYSANLINQYSRNPFQYMESVESANRSSKLLNDVMNKLIGEAKGSSEDTALKLVYQERELGLLTDKVGSLQSSLSNSNTEMDRMHEDISDKERQIMRSKNKIKFQKAMDKVRKSFSDKEASVYQQGDKLIIRLKKINFKSGDASIPTKSITLLSRINSIITELNPEEVIVEGHTDSTGLPGNNELLSKKRAKAVKEYLTSLDNKYQVDTRGYGESKPIADNSTRSGRALNRRVDIVVRGKDD